MICLEENCFGLRHVGLVRLMYDRTWVQMYGVGDGVVDKDSEGDSDGIDVDNEGDGDTSSDSASEVVVDGSSDEKKEGDGDDSLRMTRKKVIMIQQKILLVKTILLIQ